MSHLRFSATLALCVAIVICYVSENLNARFAHRTETINEQRAILERTPFVPDPLPEPGANGMLPAAINALL
jgi:hypothetical protein